MQDPVNGRHRHHRDPTKRHRPKPPEPRPIVLGPRQVLFRLLCPVNAVGGVIGNSGSIIKNLERDTGAKIQVDPTVPGCVERVINIVGDAAVERKIVLAGDTGSAEECEVSQAQEALFRVFEKVLEVEGINSGVIRCRLLLDKGQAGVVIGRGGSVVDTIRKSTGCRIRVLPADQLPSCSSPSDELIQIMGGDLVIKHGLLAVSHRLQLHPSIERSPTERVSVGTSSYVSLPNPHLELVPQNSRPLPMPLPSSSADYSTGNSLSADVDRTLSLVEETVKHEVVFRLLCSTSVVGGLIGKGGTIVRTLEKETGASIKMAVPVAGCNERVATVSAMENPEPLYSSAQSGVVRVFARSVEVSAERGLIAGLSNREAVTARLLVPSDQVSFLLDEGGRVAPDISGRSGLDIQILEGNLIPTCAGENDKVIQIIGEYENVKSALFQVAGLLRSIPFSSMEFSGGARSHSYSAGPDITPSERGAESISSGLNRSSNIALCNPKMADTQGMDHSRLMHTLDGPITPRLQSSQKKSLKNEVDVRCYGKGLTTFGNEWQQGSAEQVFTSSRTVEVAFPEHAFCSIFGEDGSNMARLEQISCAKIIIQAPCDGESEGKVVISGTPDQIKE
ncbi:KH domain-containing protein HEN4-like isoform X2 [Diospyros lotus]|uniref:KH domain-containing protein HEN4-like isoform X2 n=1 Tax=Diospyros lotus TaxID=55363 RepID=UPI002251964A|nr:KH domain-containing protein HEN4-like isoform X2 [Diospyros lotus]